MTTVNLNVPVEFDEAVLVKNTLRYNSTIDMGSTDVDLAHKKYVDDNTLSTSGNNYLYVQGTGTPLENGSELLDAYTQAKSMTPNGNALSKENRVQIFIGPGEYRFSDEDSILILDTDYIDILSLSKKADVVLTLADSSTTSDGGEAKSIDVAAECYVRGIYTDHRFGLRNNLDNTVIEKCVGNGDYSFDGRNPSIDFGNGTHDMSSTLIECESTGYSPFAPSYSGSSTTHAQDSKLSGTLYKCIHEGSWNDCVAGIEITGEIIECDFDSGSLSWNHYLPGSKIIRCTGKSDSFTGKIDGEHIDCYGMSSSWWSVWEIEGKLIRCRKDPGSHSFSNVLSELEPGGQVIMCQDQDETIIDTTKRFNINQKDNKTTLADTDRFEGQDTEDNFFSTNVSDLSDNILANRFISTNTTYTVGTGGDFSTISEALTHAQKFKPSLTEKPTITINLLSGFVVEEQVIVDGIDLSHVTITGEDPTTTIQKESLTQQIRDIYPHKDTSFGRGNQSFAFLAINGAKFPLIDQLFDMDTSGAETFPVNGFFAYDNSIITFTSNSGCTNAKDYGAYAYHNSTILAQETTFDECGTGGIRADRLSFAEFTQGSANDCGTFGVNAHELSSINALDAECVRAGSFGIFAQSQSKIFAQRTDARRGWDGVELSETNNDFYCDRGSSIWIHRTIDSLGGTNIVPNVSTPNGTIYAAGEPNPIIWGNNESFGMGGSPDSSAIIDLQSTQKGFLPPRMSSSQRDAISSPAAGLFVYNTDSDKINFYNGTSWRELDDRAI